MVIGNSRISVDRVPLRHLIEIVLDGTLVVPIAPPWSLEQRVLLMDSIVRGYPVGAVTRFRRGNVDEVIDGAARVTAIVRAITTPEIGWDLYAWRAVPVSEPHHFPLATAWDVVSADKARRGLDRPTSNRMRNVTSQLHDAWIPMISFFGSAEDTAEVRRRMTARLRRAGE